MNAGLAGRAMGPLVSSASSGKRPYALVTASHKRQARAHHASAHPTESGLWFTCEALRVSGSVPDRLPLTAWNALCERSLIRYTLMLFPGVAPPLACLTPRPNMGGAQNMQQDKDMELHVCFRRSYDVILKHHHTFIIRSLVAVSPPPPLFCVESAAGTDIGFA